MRKISCVFVLLCFYAIAQSQTPVSMSAQAGLTYTESFSDIANWTYNGTTGTFTSGIGSAPWKGNAVATGSGIPNANVMTTSTLAFSTGSSGGVQKGTGVIQFLTTGTTANSTSLGFDLFLDFTNVNAGALSFNAATVFNSTGDRVGTLRVYASIDGSNWTQLTGPNLPYVATNNVAGSASITSIALPASFNGSPTARLRFYYYNGDANGTAGSRPKISIDNLTVTANNDQNATPSVIVFPSSLTGFNTTSGVPSPSQSFTTSGSNLTDNITVTPPTPYEVSTDSLNFGSSLSLTRSNGTVTNTKVYVRIGSSAAAGAVTGNITLSSTGAIDKTVSVSGTVNAAISIDPPQSFSVTAVSISEIDLFATGNAGGNNIVVAYNTTSSFGTPSGALSAGNTINGGGTVLYSGPSAGFSYQHTGLSPSTTYYYSIWSVDASNNYSTPLTANATTNAPPNPHVVLNQVYGGGGNSGATYKNDFIELYNNENFAVSLNGMSVQYASATGSFTQNTPLSGSIPSHGFYLVQEGAGAGGTVSLPTPDATGTINMSGTGGKVALVNGTTNLAVACPTTPNVIDLVGYGAVTCFEGTGPTIAPSNTTAVIRVPDGDDSNDNGRDFQLAAPNPRNSPYSTTAPVITALNPTDDNLNVPNSNVTTIVFDKSIVKGTGNITVYENGVALPAISVTSSAVTVSGNTVNIAISYAPAKSYYILIDGGAFKDAFGNNFAGISDPTTWNFTTVLLTPPVTFDFQKCTGSGLLPDGFSQFSETGSAVWDCTPFGRDPNSPSGTSAFPNAVQINGFTNGTNVANVDWLISPSIDLTSTTFPLLSYWSRTAFNGLPLQLRVSTDYVSGDPRLATWTDINGKFPQQTSNTWTLSDNINLSAFKGSNVHFAFVYTSSNEDGARWTVDDISIANSTTPPPPSLTVGANDIQFGYVAGGSTGDKTFSFTGNDLTQGVTVTASGAFLVSKDGSSFSSSINYPVDEVNNIATTVYVRFLPTQNSQNFTGSITVNTSDLSGTINTNGTSIDPATTLEVVNWNMEWFGSTSLGPTNDDQQEQNADKILNNVGADIFGLVEVVDETRLARIVSHMPGYSYVICNYGSHTNPFESGAGPLSEAQKEAFVYKTNMFSNISTIPLVTNGVNTAADLSNPAYNYFSSGRYPFMMTADVSLGGVTKTIRFVLLHAKANTSPTATAYARRKAGADTLKYTLNKNYPGDNILMLGDFNDDLDSTITDGIHPRISSYYTFTNDTVSTFSSPTLALSLAGKKSTVSYNDMIDHVMLSNEMQPWYMQGSATVLSDVTSLVSNYGSTTSDHYPVFTRYMFCTITPPTDTTVSNDKGQCGAVVNFDVASTMPCGTVTAVPASGSFFQMGTTTVRLTASTGDTASFKVTVVDYENPVLTAPADVIADADAGLCGTASDHVNLGNASPTDNCPGTTVTNDAPSFFPVGITTVTWTATDASGNTATATQLVTIEDHQLPTIIQPADTTVNSEPGKCSATISLLTPQTTDNCGVASVISDAPENAVYTVGIHVVTWTVTDVHGNTASTTQRVTVNDSEKPTVTTCPSVPVFCYNPSGSYTIPAIVATDNCGSVTDSYVISGATSRVGNSSNASGSFNIGVSTITWTVTDSHNNTTTCQTTVTINSPVTSRIPDVYAVSPGGSANTIYIGYGPSSLTLNAVVSGGSGSYSYKWTIGSPAGPALNSTASFSVSPGSATTYYFNVKDVYGCSAPLTSRTVNVLDVRCGTKLDKVTVCSVVKGKPTSSCISQKDVAAALASQSTLGSCLNSPATTRATNTGSYSPLTINGMPNPSHNYFTLLIDGGEASKKVILQVTDLLGRVVDQKTNLQTNSVIQIGSKYRPGTYIAEVIQGTVHKQIKLVKL